jgi:hypothetical protein
LCIKSWHFSDGLELSSRNGWAGVTGGVLVGAIALYSELSGATISPRIYLLAVVLVLFQAMFSAWRKEERGRIEAEEQIVKTNNLRAVREQIGAYMFEGQRLDSRCFQGETLTFLERDIVDWLTRLDAFLASSVGQSYVVRARNSAGLPAFGFRAPGEVRQREIDLMRNAKNSARSARRIY